MSVCPWVGTHEIINVTIYFNPISNWGTDYTFTPVYSVSMGEAPTSGSVTVIPVLLPSTVVSSMSAGASTSAMLLPSPASSDRLVDEYSVPGPGNGGVSDKE